MGLYSSQTLSAGTASISSDKQEVLAQSLQQDVALLDCDPFSAGLSARAVPTGVTAFPDNHLQTLESKNHFDRFWIMKGFI